MVGSSSQQYEVVGEMKQYSPRESLFRSLPVPHTNVDARYLRHHDTIWELPTAQYVEGMLNEHGMKSAKTCGHPCSGMQR